jgi:hypothetical protein
MSKAHSNPTTATTTSTTATAPHKKYHNANDKIIQDPTKRLQKTELNSEFNVWYQSIYGRKGPNMKDVHSYMDKRFGKYERSKSWVGVRINYEQEQGHIDNNVVDYIEELK